MSDKPALLDDCFLHDKDRLRHEEALAILMERVGCVVGEESIPLMQSHGRVISQPVTAPRNVPLTDNSAVDGYAFTHDDYLAQDGEFDIGQRIAAGDRDLTALEAGRCARIFTGASMPPGADSVAMQEDCQLSEDGMTVSIPGGLKAGANCRKAGEDLAEGQQMFAPGTRLRPQDVAALASIGLDHIPVYQPLRVALVSTGDEIVRPGVPIKPGQVYDSNYALLTSLLDSPSIQLDDLGVWPDDAAETERRLVEASQIYDLIFTTGGASRGEEDHIITSIEKLGTRHMWQLAIKPGRPMSFSQIGGAVLLGLPGNPVAAMICYLLYGRLVIQQMQGMHYKEPLRFKVPAGFSIARKKPDRREFLRGKLAQDEDGSLVVNKYGRDGSGLISSLREADGLIEIDEATTSLEQGSLVDFLPFSQLDCL